jgi:O-antigen/teichoic acid export membrane protein
VSVGAQLKRLGSQSAIYGLGGIVSRLVAIVLIPIYANPQYLGRVGFGRIETIIALTGVLVIVLRLGITSAFFRYYFDSEDEAHRTLVVRTSFWFTMGMATLGLALGFVFAAPLSDALKLHDPWLVRAGFVGLWAQMNYAQMTSLFRVEERPVQFAIASVANVAITIGSTIALVVGAHKGAIGAVIGNFLGTLTVYSVLLAHRRYQLGFQFDRRLLRGMNRFGMPLVPAALALWAINFVDRLFIGQYKGQAEVGVYSLAVRVASVIVFVMTAFQLAWPAFAYSIRDDDEARRTYAFVLTYLLFVTCWISLALGALAPWIVDVLATPKFSRAAEAVPLLAFATAAYSGYSVLAIGIGRARQTQYNWIVAGAAAIVNIGLNLILIPPYGMIGAAVATLAAYVVLFVAMWLNSRRVYPVPYQWRRVLSIAGTAAALTAIVWAVDAPLPLAIVLVLAYPLVLAALGFYLPAERKRIRRLLPSRA